MAMSTLIKSLEDIMRIDAGLNGDAQYIEQITWMLFLKAFDAKEQEWELEDYYKPVIPEGYRWRDWAENDEGDTGDKLLRFVDDIFDTLKNLDISDGDARKYVVRNVFEDINNYMKSGTQLRQLVNSLNEKINFNDAKERHMFNSLYEEMLKDLQSAGRAGEFYTPRPVTRFIVEKVAPKLGEKLLDPACGTGGFLTSVIELWETAGLSTVEDYRRLQESINGIEKKPLPYLLAMTNLILHDIETPNIRHDNSLRRPVTDYSAAEKFEVIVTNPPFGGAEENSISQSVPSEFRTKETADLFLVLIMYLLKDGGRCGLVLPDGFLFGTGVKTAIKKRLLESCNLHTIIRLPKDVFAPYTNINTNLLFFSKGKPTKGVWFYRFEMPEGYKHFSKTKPMLDCHFDLVRQWWDNRQESEISKYVPAQDIDAADYNLDICSFPHEISEILAPDEFMANYRMEKSVLTAKIEEIIARIEKAMEVDG